MGPREDYAVICQHNLSELTREVEEYQKNGWKCTGGICVVSVAGYSCMFYQAMVKMIFS